MTSKSHCRRRPINRNWVQPMSPVSAISTRYLCRGRVCQCGERVTTSRIREDEQLNPEMLPSNFRFYCPNGHVHFLGLSQVTGAPLQWVEEVLS